MYSRRAICGSGLARDYRNFSSSTFTSKETLATATSVITMTVTAAATSSPSNIVQLPSKKPIRINVGAVAGGAVAGFLILRWKETLQRKNRASELPTEAGPYGTTELSASGERKAIVEIPTDSAESPKENNQSDDLGVGAVSSRTGGSDSDPRRKLSRK